MTIAKLALPAVSLERSAVMRAVKSRDTGPERAVRSLCGRSPRATASIAPICPGKPDIVYAKRKLAIFVHGCFWHGHDCPRGARLPKANAAYWRAKIGRNRARDERPSPPIRLWAGASLVVYECELKDRASLVARLAAALRPD